MTGEFFSCQRHLCSISPSFNWIFTSVWCPSAWSGAPFPARYPSLHRGTPTIDINLFLFLHSVTGALNPGAPSLPTIVLPLRVESRAFINYSLLWRCENFSQGKLVLLLTPQKQELGNLCTSARRSGSSSLSREGKIHLQQTLLACGNEDLQFSSIPGL